MNVEDYFSNQESDGPAPAIKADDDQSGFSGSYAKHSKEQGLDPNPDNPEHHYDYRSAYGAGVVPDEAGHMDSRFKDDGHPNLVVGGVNTKTGEPAQSVAGDFPLAVAENDKWPSERRFPIYSVNVADVVKAPDGYPKEGEQEEARRETTSRGPAPGEQQEAKRETVSRKPAPGEQEEAPRRMKNTFPGNEEQQEATRSEKPTFPPDGEQQESKRKVKPIFPVSGEQQEALHPPVEAPPEKAAEPAKAGKKWEMWDPSRRMEPKEFKRVASDVMSKLSAASGEKRFDAPGMVKLLGLTASNETHLGAYLKAPGTSTQRGMFQITDATLKDLYRYMERSPGMRAAVESLRTPGVPITQDLESNAPLGMALASIRYLYPNKPIPDSPEGMADFYKINYNTYHPLAKATVRGALANYNKYFGGAK